MRIIITTISLLIILFPLGAFNQETVNDDITVSSSTAVLLGKTIEVRNIQNSQSPKKYRKPVYKKNKQMPDGLGKRRPNNGELARPHLEHLGPDELRQIQNAHNGVSHTILPIHNFDGLNSSSNPQDPTGDVGYDYYIQAINATTVGIYLKTTGEIIQEFEMEQLWSSLGVNSAGDPIILYDDVEQRWFITEFTNPANVLIAVSETSDPLGSYYAYNFSTPDFPDYPKYGIWPNELVLTVNEDGPEMLDQYFIEKSALINGEETANIQKITSSGQDDLIWLFTVSSPVDIDGLLPPSDPRPITLAIDESTWGDSEEDGIILYKYDLDWENPDNTVVEETTIALSAFDTFPCDNDDGWNCIAQMDGAGIGGIPQIIFNVPKLRRYDDHESMVFCFITDVTDGENFSGIRWVELRKQIGEGEEWQLHQEGTYSPEDGLERFMASIALDESGNIGLGYAVSSENTFAGVRFTGRMEEDPLGIMTAEEYTVVEGLSGLETFGRFGDYSHMSVDPNGRTFWYTSEYAGPNSSALTRIVSFEMDPVEYDLELTAILNPTTSTTLTANETVSIEVTNTAIFPMNNFTIGYYFGNVLIEEELIENEIAPGDSYTHDFTTELDLSSLGEYLIDAYVSHPEDENITNDTQTSTVYQLLSLNASLINLSAPEETCNPNEELVIQFENMGLDPIENAVIDIVVNGAPQNSIDWSGNLEFQELEEISTTLDLTLGINFVDITISSVNGSLDQDDMDNSQQVDIAFEPSLAYVSVEVLTDEYAYETFWEIVNNETSEVVASFGPYSEESTLHTHDICLNSEDCYTFTIYDTWGDGICCAYGEGSYSVSNSDGELISGGEFQYDESLTFCGDGDVSGNSITELLEDQYDFIISPNPNDGYFKVHLDTKYFSGDMITMKIFDSKGSMIQKRNVGSYDGIYTTPISLVAYSSGNYIISFEDGNFRCSEQVIKN